MVNVLERILLNLRDVALASCPDGQSAAGEGTEVEHGTSGKFEIVGIK